jgi:hypothetical protein
MAPVDLVTIHHEAGASPPTDDVQRFASGGYAYGVGATLWERFRAPADNWATLNFNGEDLSICMISDRHTQCEVTPGDIELIHGAYLDCYARGEVTAAPLVRAHRNSPGSATACPGDFTMAVWADVEAACRPGKAPPDANVPNDPAAKGLVETMIVECSKAGAKANEQPYGWLDAQARKVWSWYGFEISWEGGDGDSVLHGDTDPRWIGVPGSAPLIGWEALDDIGASRRVRAYGWNGAQYSGSAHG